MKQLYALALCTLTAFTGFAQTTYPSGVTGCIGRWDFSSSGTVTSLPDVSGNNNNGYVRGPITASADFRGVTNRAMKFNGSSTYAAVPHASMLNPAILTMMAVVKFDGFYSGSCNASNILGKGPSHGSPGTYAMGTYDNAYDGSCAIFSPNNQQIHYLLGSATNSVTAPPPGNYFETTKWYLEVVSYNGTDLRLYKIRMDTAHITSVAPIIATSHPSSSIGSNTDSLIFGKLNNNAFPYWLNAKLDEAILFNKQLTQTEVQSVYDYLWGLVTINPLSATTLCHGNSFTVNYTVANSTMCQTGNVFSVQLSNASGSFTTPVTIGTLTATNSGSITCNIPAGTASGTGYRIRIAASLPSYVNPDNGANITISATAAPNISANSPICEGDTLFLSTSSTGVSYQWFGPAGFNPTMQSPQINQVTFANGGVYKLQLVLPNGCKSDTAYNTVTVNATPVMPMVSSNSPICFGDTLYLTAMGNGPTYTWHGPANFSATQQNPQINGVTTNNAGTYGVIASNGSCAADTVFTTVSVQAQLQPPTATANSPLCVGDTLHLTASGSPGTYLWQGPGGFGSSQQNPQLNGVSLANAGVYIVRAVLGDCESEPASVPVNVLTIAPATITVNANTGTYIQPGQLVVFNAFTTNAGSNPTFAWFINSVIVPGATTSTYSTTTLQSNDKVSVAVYSNNPCAQPNADTADYQVYYTGIGNVQNTLQGIILYPNPTQGALHLQGNLPGNKALVEVYNTLGQRVHTATLEAANHKLDATIQLDKSLASGLYQVRVSSEGQAFTATISLQQ